MRQTSPQRAPAEPRDDPPSGRAPDGRAVAREEPPNREFVGRLFREYNDSLVRYLSVRLRSVRDAEEVAQEAYARMLKLDQLDTISHLQAYLFKIAANIAVDRLRKTGRRPEHVSVDALRDGVEAPASGVDRTVDAEQRLKALRDIIAELPPKCRRAFLLYKFEERSYAEIAADMRLTESMIRKYVRRAIVYCSTRMEV